MRDGSYRIVFLGCSNTSTEWVHPNWREMVEYVLKSELENLGPEPHTWQLASWGIRCFNAGFDGATTADILTRLEHDVFSLAPTLVIASLGKNDMHLSRTAGDYCKDIATLTDQLATRVPGSVFMTPLASAKQEVNDRYAEYQKSVLALFPKPDIQFINLFQEFQAVDPSRIFTFHTPVANEYVGFAAGEIDFIHPNQLGYAYVAKIVLDQVFGISFDPELYIKNNNAGEMYPTYK